LIIGNCQSMTYNVQTVYAVKIIVLCTDHCTMYSKSKQHSCAFIVPRSHCYCERALPKISIQWDFYELNVYKWNSSMWDSETNLHVNCTCF